MERNKETRDYRLGSELNLLRFPTFAEVARRRTVLYSIHTRGPRKCLVAVQLVLEFDFLFLCKCLQMLAIMELFRLCSVFRTKLYTTVA